MHYESIAQNAKEASRRLAIISTGKKNSVLQKMINLLKKNKKEIVDLNKKDIALAQEAGLPDNILNRLVFDEQKIDSRINSLKKIIELPDPVGQIREMERRPNGLMVARMNVPLGVIMMIYEARPHVTINAGAFALKSGNAIILKGGKEATLCNTLLGKFWQEALLSEDLPEQAIQYVSATHDEVNKLLRLSDYIDLVIPRGGKSLIKSVIKNSRIPVIKHFEGICHVYIDDSADMLKAMKITLNSKLLMPQVCNAAETLLIAEEGAEEVPKIVRALQKKGVEVRGCKKTQILVHDTKLATKIDWETEYLDKIISLRIVKGIDEAIDHINKYGSGHTDTIVTENYTHANRFLREVDSAVVLVNASTMFDDGEELGMGAEIGISTDKLHARGPMGLKELVSYKIIVQGDGHIKRK